MTSPLFRNSLSLQALWLKQNEPELFAQAEYVCEYQVSFFAQVMLSPRTRPLLTERQKKKQARLFRRVRETVAVMNRCLRHRLAFARLLFEYSTVVGSNFLSIIAVACMVAGYAVLSN